MIPAATSCARLERAIAIAQQNVDAGGVVVDGQVEPTVTVEITGHDFAERATDADRQRYRLRGLERAVTVAQRHSNVAGSAFSGEVETSVTIEITRHNRCGIRRTYRPLLFHE